MLKLPHEQMESIRQSMLKNSGVASPSCGVMPCAKRTIVQIKAKVPTTQSARGTHAVAPPITHHEFFSTSQNKPLSANAPTVLLRNCHDLELEAITSPPNQTDIVWKIESNPGPTPLPLLTPSGSKAKLKTDAAGGYSISATLDGTTVFWNLVLAEVRINSSQILRNSANFKGITSGNFATVNSGDFDLLNPSKCAMFVKANITIFAGGAATLAGYLDKVHVGFPQSILTMTPNGVYPGGKRERYRIDIIDRSANLFITNPADTVTDLGAPALDRGGPQATRATGGATIFLSMTRSSPTTGAVRNVETCDSPSLPFHILHPAASTATEVLTKTAGGIDFRVFLVAYSDDANYTYVAFGRADWHEDFGGKLTLAGGTSTWTRTTAGITGAGSALTKIEHGKEAKDAGCEVRPPSALANLCCDTR